MPGPWQGPFASKTTELDCALSRSQILGVTIRPALPPHKQGKRPRLTAQRPPPGCLGPLASQNPLDIVVPRCKRILILIFLAPHSPPHRMAEIAAAAAAATRTVHLVSQEGESFEVSLENAKMSELVKTMIDESTIPFRLKIHQIKLVSFCATPSSFSASSLPSQGAPRPRHGRL